MIKAQHFNFYLNVQENFKNTKKAETPTIFFQHHFFGIFGKTCHTLPSGFSTRVSIDEFERKKILSLVSGNFRKLEIGLVDKKKRICINDDLRFKGWKARKLEFEFYFIFAQHRFPPTKSVSSGFLSKINWNKNKNG